MTMALCNEKVRKKINDYILIHYFDVYQNKQFISCRTLSYLPTGSLKLMMLFLWCIVFCNDRAQLLTDIGTSFKCRIDWFSAVLATFSQQTKLGVYSLYPITGQWPLGEHIKLSYRIDFTLQTRHCEAGRPATTDGRSATFCGPRLFGEMKATRRISPLLCSLWIAPNLFRSTRNFGQHWPLTICLHSNF